MKVDKKAKVKKNKVSKKGAVTKSKPRTIRKEEVLVVAQEIKYARLLSGNEKKTRDRVLKALKKWLTNCFEKGYEFKEDDFTRVWKGLFYAVWMSDKPLVQEELCESIAGILDQFPAEELRHAMLMTRAGFRTLATEWYGIDQHRIDKFLMLVRRYLRGSLRCLARCEWSLESCQKYAKMLSSRDGILAPQTPPYARNASSLQLHIIDCFLEEVAKVSEGRIPEASLAALLAPFAQCACGGALPAACAARRLLAALLRHSAPGQRYADRTRAWQRMGCPEGGPDALEPVSDDEEDPRGEADGDEESDDGGEKPLDPRAGRVDVELPLLPVPAALLASMLRELLGKSTSKAHKRIKIYLERFESLAAGEYPFKLQVPDPVGVAVGRPKRSLRALQALDAKIKSDTDELKLRGLSRKHRKRLLMKTRLGQSIVEDVEQLRRTSNKKHKNGEWLVESTATEAKDKDTSNKENQRKKKSKPADKTLKRKLENRQTDIASKKTKVEKNKETSKKDESPKKAKGDKIKEKEVKKEIKEKRCIDKEAIKKQKHESPKVLVNKLKHYSKQLQKDSNDKKEMKNFVKDVKKIYDTPKKVKFVLKNNSMQQPVDYYKSVRQSPSIPFDSSKMPNKTNLKPSSPSPINPFFKKKLRIKH